MYLPPGRKDTRAVSHLFQWEYGKNFLMCHMHWEIEVPQEKYMEIVH